MEPRIADFGLAKDILDDTLLTQTGQVVGTPAFMSLGHWVLVFGAATTGSRPRFS